MAPQAVAGKLKQRYGGKSWFVNATPAATEDKVPVVVLVCRDKRDALLANVPLQIDTTPILLREVGKTEDGLL